MPLKTISTGRGLMGGGTYADKVRGFGPIAYWPLWEKNGTVAKCLVNPAQNGTYNADVSGWPPGPGIGDGNTAPWFDGANDYINIFSATLQTTFNGQLGTWMIWVKVNAAGVWADGVQRYSFHVVDLNDFREWVHMSKAVAANTLIWHYQADNVVESITRGATTSIDWICMIITWSLAADTVQAFYNGTSVGTSGTLGTWAGTIDRATIGSVNTTPNSVWHGWLAHCAAWNRVLAPSEIIALSSVR